VIPERITFVSRGITYFGIFPVGIISPTVTGAISY